MEPPPNSTVIHARGGKRGSEVCGGFVWNDSRPTGAACNQSSATQSVFVGTLWAWFCFGSPNLSDLFG